MPVYSGSVPGGCMVGVLPEGLRMTVVHEALSLGWWLCTGRKKRKRNGGVGGGGPEHQSVSHCTSLLVHPHPFFSCPFHAMSGNTDITFKILDYYLIREIKYMAEHIPHHSRQ